MIKKTIKEIIKVSQEIDVEIYETEDGRQFKSEDEAIEHEKVGILKKKNIKSNIINNEYLTQYIGKFKFVYFENEKQIEAYEQVMCDNRNDNVWGSWISYKNKFKFPSWIMCYYVPHSINKYSCNDDFTAVYMTLDEVKKDLNNVIKQINELGS